MAPTHPTPGPRLDPDGQPRQRIIAGLAASLVERGFHQTGIAEVARHARTSKRTFYVHFRDREQCLVALYLDFFTDLLDAVQRQAEEGPRAMALDRAVDALIDGVAEQPQLTRELLLDTPSVPSRAALERRSVAERMAWLLADAARAADGGPDTGEHWLDPDLAAGLCGGIWAIVLRELEAGDARGLTRARPTVQAFTRRVLTASRT